MPIRPSSFMWQKFKDFVHLYVMIGYIPTVCLATYLNLTVGPAELTETPDGYEPAIWEYEKHPVTRLLTRLAFDHPAEDYERKMHVLNQENENVLLKRIELQVRNVMSIRNDYQAWYYYGQLTPAKGVRHMRDKYYRFGEMMGVRIGRRDVEEDLSAMESPAGGIR